MPVLRPMVPADVDALLGFYRSLPPWIVHWFEPWPGVDRGRIEAHLTEAAAGEAVSLGLCDDAGAVLGHVFILAFCGPRPVFGIGLREEWVGKGWGRRMAQAVLCAADARELPLVTLTVFKDNARARHLYESLGFAVTGGHSARSPSDSLAMERCRPAVAAGGGMRASTLSLLRGGAAVRIPWAADLTYWMAGEKAKGRADPAWDDEEGFVAFHQGLGTMPYYDYGKFAAAVPVYDATVHTAAHSAGNRTRHSLRTPRGELWAEYVELPDSASTGCARHFVQTEDDLDVLTDLIERRRLAPANLDDYWARAAMWARHDGLPALGLPRSPLPAFCYEWAGVQNAAYLIADCEDKVRRLFALMEAQEAPVIHALCELHPPLVHFPDNLDSENLTGLYDRFLADTHRRRLEPLHAAGIACAVHLDGAVRGLLPKLAAARFDAVEALTPHPAGDATVDEMRALIGNASTILWGGVPGVLFAPPCTWDAMRRHVEHTLDAWRGRPFMLGVADQVSPDGDITFCRRIAALLEAR
ncbi:MAG: Mycothiol acetyltransferase [Lentisphaerae bacterium ADurb.BinA184]|nr:MAG: Mycothiol acetyltransferase [Lentisphaerae bacterium ADurb.BinA184]